MLQRYSEMLYCRDKSIYTQTEYKADCSLILFDTKHQRWMCLYPNKYYVKDPVPL